MARPRLYLLALLGAFALAEAASAEVVVGVAGPADGQGASAARDVARAARLAAKRINAEGGLLGEPVSVVEVDDGCTAAQAEAAARALIAKGAAIVIGHPCANAAVAAAKVYAAAGTLFLAPATRHEALTNPRAGPTVFRVSGRDERQGASAGDYLARTYAGKAVAVVRDGSGYAKALGADAAAALKAAGVPDVPIETVAGAQKDFASLVGKLRDAGTEALFFAGFPLEGGLLLRQMRAAGLKTIFIGSDALATAEFADAAGEAAEGAGALLPFDAARARDGAPAPLADQDPTDAFVSAYAALEAWRIAVGEAKSLGGEAVAAALQAGSFDTVRGRLSFDDKGNADVPSYDIVWWKAGAWRHAD